MLTERAGQVIWTLGRGQLRIATPKDDPARLVAGVRLTGPLRHEAKGL